MPVCRMAALSLFWLLLAGCGRTSSETYYITLSPSDLCPVEVPCLTLSQFVDNSSNHLNHSTSFNLVFQPGNHILDSEISITAVSNFSMLSSFLNATIMCNNSGRFVFNSIYVVHVSNLTFVGCTGNRVELVTRFLLEDSNFIGRKDIIGTTLTLVNTSASLLRCTFRSNRLCRTSVHQYHTQCSTAMPYNLFEYSVGGAVALTGSNITIVESTFDENSDGTIYSALDSIINIVNSIFMANHFTYRASGDRAKCGILCAGSGTIVTFQDSQFINNSAQNGGALVYAKDGVEKITFIRSHFIKSHDVVLSIANDPFQCTVGGMCSRSNVTITHCVFISNFAGIIHAGYGVDITISHSSFINNSAQNATGGVVYAGDTVHIIISHSHFFNNCAYVGGVIGVEMYIQLNISHSEFINNCAHFSGGVIYAAYDYINIDITHSQFNNNSALGLNDDNLKTRLGLGCDCDGGGVVVACTVEHMTISHTQFINNSALGDGGVLWLQQIIMEMSITESNFTNNRASNGGAIHAEGIAILFDINNSRFNYNMADHDGGVMSLQQCSDTTVQGGIFHGNSAGHDGGVITSQGGSTTIYGGSFDGNSADHDGGVFQVNQETINTLETMYSNNTALNDGGVIHVYQSITTISECSFSMNTAMTDGGAINAYQGSLSISRGTAFSYNTAHNDGGSIHTYELDMTATGNSYNFNKAWNRGGVWSIYQGNVVLTQSILSHSKAAIGGVMYVDQGNITLSNTSCVGNKADEGGVLYTDWSILYVSHSSFGKNSADKIGGGWLMENSQATLQHTSFIGNAANIGGAVFTSNSSILLNTITFKQNAASDGGAIHLTKTHLNSFDSLFIHNNRANVGVVYLIGSVANLHNQTEFSHNSGSCLLFNSDATFEGTVNFINCSEPIQSRDTTGIIIREGGAFTLVKSNIVFTGSSTLMYNHANNGGAIHASESKLYINGEMTVVNNTANETGGGVYLHVSEVHCQTDSHLKLLNNFATKQGGGVHAISSSINVNMNASTYSGSLLDITDNEAEKGGGLCLEVNSKVYILKSTPYYESFSIVNFTGNSANYGGAIYVSDDSNPGVCNPNYNSHYKAKECFFQISAVYSSTLANFSINSQNIFFSHNHAITSGSSFYGGLINRCKLQQFTEFQNLSQSDIDSPTNSSQDVFVGGLSYMTHISNLNISDIGSEPVQLCFCKDNLADCNYQPNPIRVNKGKGFSIELVAVDQVKHPVNATIHSLLFKTLGGLRKDQATQNISEACSMLNFNLFSPYDKEELIMSAESSCMSSPQSQRRLTIEFTACNFCPIGFEKFVDIDTACECVCDSKLKPYITRCNATSELLIREGEFWITYVDSSNNATSGYLIYAYCPLNYCKTPTSLVEINLNIPNGADAQCAYGRSGILCGTCQSNLSLSLGSSRCIPCSNNWPTIVAILIAALLAGIAVVTILLALNLTVAVGTLNGIIFYANVVAANSSTFLPFSKPNFITVFISWLNLEIGFDTCFLAGMNAYWKTLLQLAFPTYVIFLVVMVIFISERSTKFARLVSKRNPVATLATLILLSYNTFLNTVIASLSFAILDYPDGTHQIVWLPDATVSYLRGKHIVLFIVAILILLTGVAYTVLLFSWQWLLHHQDKKVFKWTRHQKLCHFIEPYHAPYTFEQRYWTGLLLLVRVVLYIISAVNVTGDPRVSLVSTNVLVGLLPLVKGVLEKKIYKKWPVDVMEMIVYFNIISFAAVTLQTETTIHQIPVAYTSVVITFTLLLSVLLYHVYHYTGLFSVVKMMKTSVEKFQEYRKNNHTGQAGISEAEDDLPLITHSTVEFPIPDLEQSRLQSVIVNTSSDNMVMDDKTDPTASQFDFGPQLDAENTDHESNPYRIAQITSTDKFVGKASEPSA